MNEVGALVLAAVLVLCAAAAWWLRTRDGALRPGAGRADADGEVAVLRRLGVRPDEADLTVVQFSTSTCAPCRATRAQLDRLRAEREAYLRQVTAGWTDEELTTFTTLFDRLLDGVAATLPSDPMSLSADRTVSA